MIERILVIEDNPADFRQLQLAIAEIGAFHIQFTGVPTLAEAMDRLGKTAFQVALLDLSLPDTDGLDGLKILREAAPELPVLVLTGRDDAELAVEAVRQGAQDYLVKGQVSGPLLLRAMRYAEERLRSTLQLKRSEERLRSLLENALDIVAIVGGDRRISYASESVERVLGYRAEEMVGRPVCDFVHPAELGRMEESLGDAFRERATRTMEFRVRARDGQWRVLETMTRNLLDNPHIGGVVVNARDVTERKEYEERLRQAKEHLSAVIETSPLAIYVLDLDGVVLSWSRAAERIFGWSEQEVLSSELPVAGRTGRAGLVEILEQARSGLGVGPVEARYVRKDGQRVEVSYWTAPLRDDKQRPIAVVVVVADVTEQRRLEDQFRQAQKMEAIGRLAGGVAHDFNNLLTVITGYSRLATTRLPKGSPADSDLREVLRAADRAASLTKQLLALSRRKVLEPALLDLNLIVTEMESMLHRVLGEDIRLIARLEPALRPIRADRAQMEMVLLNLAINARDAMPRGGVLSIATSNLEGPSGDLKAGGHTGPFVLVEIRDTGCGMDAQTRARIFEPFFTTKEAGKGSGLGLSTSYGIVRQHGGDIWVESEPGGGALFRIYFPSAEAGERREPYLAASTPEPVSGSETILVVEDEPAVASMMRESLRLHGYQVLEAEGPERALEIVSCYPQPIHLLISDMVLHSGHGVDLARQIRRLRPGIPVLFVSGYTGAGQPGQSFIETGEAFLPKPFSPEVLAAKAREVLNQKSRAAASTHGSDTSGLGRGT